FHVAVPADQGHPEPRVVRRTGHAREERLPEFEQPHAACDGGQQRVLGTCHDVWPSLTFGSSSAASSHSARSTTALSTKRPVESTHAASPVSRTVSTSDRAHATSSGSGRHASWTTGSCAGWITDRPKKPALRPFSVSARRPSRSRTAVHTLWDGLGNPAA